MLLFKIGMYTKMNTVLENTMDEYRLKRLEGENSWVCLQL